MTYVYTFNEHDNSIAQENREWYSSVEGAVDKYLESSAEEDEEGNLVSDCLVPGTIYRAIPREIVPGDLVDEMTIEAFLEALGSSIWETHGHYDELWEFEEAKSALSDEALTDLKDVLRAWANRHVNISMLNLVTDVVEMGTQSLVDLEDWEIL